MQSIALKTRTLSSKTSSSNGDRPVLGAGLCQPRASTSHTPSHDPLEGGTDFIPIVQMRKLSP